MYDTTNPDWVPSLKMGYETYHAPDQERYARLQLRKKRKIDAAEDAADEDLETGVACQTDIHVDVVDVACQTDIGMFDVARMEAELQQLKEDNQHLQNEISEAKQQFKGHPFVLNHCRMMSRNLSFTLVS